jgi:ribosomal protein L21E
MKVNDRVQVTSFSPVYAGRRGTVVGVGGLVHVQLDGKKSTTVFRHIELRPESADG